MPIVNPIQDAVYFPVTVIYSAPATVQVSRTPGAAQYAGRASAGVNGITTRAGRAGLDGRGEPTRGGFASLQAGIRADGGALGSIDSGTPSTGQGSAAMGVLGYVPSTDGRASVDVSNPGGDMSPIPRRAALGSVSIQRDASGGGAGRASLRIQGIAQGRTVAALNTKLETVRPAPATLEARIGAIRAALAGVEAGARKDGAALASAEIQAAEGVEFLIDVIDSVLATGRGDLC